MMLGRRWILAIGIACSCSVAVAETYTWVDADGKRHYGDGTQAGINQSKADAQSDHPDNDDTLAHAREEYEKAQREMRAQQALNDNFLMTTYGSSDEIARARDDRLELMEAGIQVEIENLTANQKRLDTLTAREAALIEQGQPVSKKLKTRIAEVKQRIRNNENNINQLKKQLEETAARYDRDIARFEELQSASN